MRSKINGGGLKGGMDWDPGYADWESVSGVTEGVNDPFSFGDAHMCHLLMKCSSTLFLTVELVISFLFSSCTMRDSRSEGKREREKSRWISFPFHSL